jgi:hypothetical protein
MKTEPILSDREVLAGLVERVTYQNAENGFCVIRIKARGHRELITVVGHAASPRDEATRGREASIRRPAMIQASVTCSDGGVSRPVITEYRKLLPPPPRPHLG